MLEKCCKLTIISLLLLKEVIKYNYCCDKGTDNSYSFYNKQLYAFKRQRHKIF